MTSDELDRLEALANAATPGPWVHGVVNLLCKADHRAHGHECEYTFDGVQSEDFPGMDFVVHQVETMRGEKVAGNYDWEAGGIVHPRDAAFIAAARDAVPALVASERAKDAEIARLRALVEAAYREGQGMQANDYDWRHSNAFRALEGT